MVVAIEFTHFQKDDSVYYMALLIKKSSPPVVIPLFEKRQLDAFLSNTIVGPYNETINLRYGKRNELYKMIWQPIEQYLAKIHRIYFSLSGDLYKIPVTIISINDSLKICDRYKLIQLNSTSSLVKKIDNNIAPTDNLVLYGGIFF